jgi:hypothetical protein
MDLENFNVAVRVILPVLDRKFFADVNIDGTPSIVGFCVVRVNARSPLNSDKAISQQESLLAWKRFEELNDLKVNEQPIIHSFLLGPVFNRLSISSKLAKSFAGWSIFAESFFR